MRRLLYVSIVVIGCIFSMASCFVSKTPIYEVKFLDDTCIKPHHRYNYLTCEEIFVSVNHNVITIPAGFDTDLATIPRWYWSFLSPQYSAFVAPSILHDYLYTCPGKYPRDFVDRVFYSALLAQGVSKYTASKMYIAVRLFGQAHFNEGYTCKNLVEKMTNGHVTTEGRNYATRAIRLCRQHRIEA